MNKLILTPEEKIQLRRIQILMEAADSIFATIPRDRQNEILDFHNEEGNLSHCIRYGEQAATEILNAQPAETPKGKYHTKSWIFEVVSQEPITEEYNLDAALAEANDGSFSGKEIALDAKEIGWEEANALLNNHGSEGFFEEPDAEDD